ncbi:Arginase-1 [Trichoplax sp. H2]|nr:Arginase-1 [Trichoplax sp. H2]|eukprot:RDD43009.1 Arginase-1 [Trichoplax sp. H2]
MSLAGRATRLPASIVTSAHGLRYYSKMKHAYSNYQTVNIIGYPFSIGQPIDGVHLGPDAMREYGVVQRIKRDAGRKVRDLGNILLDNSRKGEQFGIVKDPATVSAASKLLSEKIQSVLEDDSLPITIGGDHSLAIGSIHGHTARIDDLCVLWIDTHADINTGESTVTGNMHGMPLSILMKELEKKRIPGFEWAKPCMTAKDIAYIGLRDVDPEEFKYIEDIGIHMATMADIDHHGMGSVFERALDTINPRRDRPLFVTWDIDVFDPSEAPSTGTTVRGGLTLREGLHLAEQIAKSGLLVGFDLVEVNPKIGSQEDVKKTMDTACFIIEALLGKTRRANVYQKR